VGGLTKNKKDIQFIFFDINNISLTASKRENTLRDGALAT
jgi:hypothetical protein